MKKLRTEILALLNRQTTESTPLFSGLINVTEAGLESEGLRFHETHRDAARMARAADNTITARTGGTSRRFPMRREIPAGGINKASITRIL